MKLFLLISGIFLIFSPNLSSLLATEEGKDEIKATEMKEEEPREEEKEKLEEMEKTEAEKNLPPSSPPAEEVDEEEEEAEEEEKEEEVKEIIPEVTGLVLMPTGYRQKRKKSYWGLNLDGNFTFYIGSLASKTMKGRWSFTQQIYYSLFCVDFKWNFLKENWWPAIASGMILGVNTEGGDGTISATLGKPIGYLYSSLSKKWRKSAFHFSFLSTPELTKVNEKNEKERFFAGGAEISNLVTYGLLGAQRSKKELIDWILGETKYTLSLGFNTTFFNQLFKLELIYPLVNQQFFREKLKNELEKNKTQPLTLWVPEKGILTSLNPGELDSWLSGSYYLVNLRISGFPFQFAFLKIPSGYSFLGYFSFRFNIFPAPEEEKKLEKRTSEEEEVVGKEEGKDEESVAEEKEEEGGVEKSGEEGKQESLFEEKSGEEEGENEEKERD